MIPRTARRRLLVAGFWPLFGVFGAVQIQLSMLDHGHSWARMLVYQVLVWSLWIGITFAIVRLLRRVPVRTFRPSALLAHGAAALAFGFLHITAWAATEFVLVPYDFMNPTDFAMRLAALAFFQMPLEVMLYGVVVLAASVDEASARAHERERTAARLEASLAAARLQALELQTQPHFLFNTLNGISSLVRAGEAAGAQAMIGGLSELLRYALDRAGGPHVPLEEEVRTVTRYLEIERLRFPDRLTFDVELAPGTARAGVPALLLQPLVENAVRHGLARSDAPGRIALSATRQGDEVVVEIFNTGRLDPARRDGIGVANTTARLAQLYDGRAGIALAERDGGVVARLHLPWSEVR
jgi:two-component system, LytTR family, sensor kinase